MAGPYRLHVAVDRGHGPVYVLLHGINSTGHDWDTVVTAMGFDRRCIAVDQLGYGRSPKPLDIEYTLDEHVESLRYTLHDIGVWEPFVLVGYSMGGPIALRYAATYREEVERLVLISAPFFLKPEEMGDEAYAKAVFQTQGSQKVLDMVRSAGFAKSGVFKKLSSEDKQVIQNAINAQDLKTDWQILQKNMYQAIQAPDFPTDLRRVKAPITFMVGEHDTFIVQSQIETLRTNHAPNMEIRFLADLKADHMLLENVPTMMAAEITRWEDRRLAVALDRGEGHIIVMLHGIENDGSFWNQVGAALATRNRAISLDLLGFGHSPRPLDIPYSVDDQVASIGETLDSLLGEDATFTLVGHSLGGLVAAGYARRHPEQVERLVIFAPPINNADVHVGGPRLDQARVLFVDNFGMFRERGARLTRRRAVKGALGHERLSRYEPSLRSLKNVIECQTLAQDLTATDGIPVTVVHGTRDPFVVPEYVHALVGLRPGIDVTTVDAAHDIATEKPLDALAAIDPSINREEAAVIVEKAKTDRKLRPGANAFKGMFDSDALLVGFRGLVYLVWGLGLVFAPISGRATLLRIGFAVFLFARSLSILTGLLTTRSIRQERLTSALMGIVGILLGVFLLMTTEIAMRIIALWVVGYLMLSGAVNLYAAFHTLHSSKRRRRLLFEGGGAVLAALLLLAGSILVARLIILFVGVIAIAAGVSLISYALVARQAGSVWSSEVAPDRA
jgi:pimeloyl-ACP methyl ester carboxylesterase/uncharacterized membrane protein HdeD (DUF308 family)